jgi:hypothetical protein
MQNASHTSQLVRARVAPAARRLMALGPVLAFACAMLAPAVQAQEAPQLRVERQQPPRELQRDMQRQELQRQEMERQEIQRQEQRAYEEQQRRVMQAQQEQQEGHRRNGRMTADERSELRRQINEANQDIYARPRGRR